MRPRPTNPALDEGELDVEVLEMLACALPAWTDLKTGQQRLRAAVEPLPLRFAPFWDRLGTLWELPAEAVEAALARAASSKSWRRAWPGFRYFDVSRSESGFRSRLLEFAPSFRFPAHNHGGPELVLPLCGGYTDSLGNHFGPGELQRMEAGSVHALDVDAGATCIVAIQQPGLSFTGPVLGRLNRWLLL